MFSGEYRHSLDEKGRITIPAKFRRFFEDGVVVVRGLDECLWVYPRQEWQGVSEKLAKLRSNNPQARAHNRVLFSAMHEQDKLDGQGRVAIPPKLRRHASLAREAVIVGLPGRMEIWDAGNWQAYLDKYEDAYTELAEQLAELEI